MKYNPKIVIAYFKECGLPEPVTEYKFAHTIGRKWRFDFAFEKEMVAVEIQGGLFSGGRHTNGAALLKEYEKLNHAAMLGWRVMFFQPKAICLIETVKMIREALTK